VGKDRAQLIVIAGLLLAVLFVGLAVVVNSAIYTENVSTRESTSSANVIADDTESLERIKESLSHANYHSNTAAFSERQGIVEDDLSEWDAHMGSGSARTGQAVGYENAGMTEGVRVSQDERGDFMPSGEDLVEGLLDETLDPFGIGERTQWLVVPNATTRAFGMTVERDSLAQTRQGLLDDIDDLSNEILTGSSEFWVQIDDGEETWRVYLVDDVDNETVAAVATEIDGNNEEIIETCHVPGGGDTATVRITTAEMESDGTTTPCLALENISDSPHDVYYIGADEVEGTYQIIIDKDEEMFRDDIDEKYDENLLEDILDSVGCTLFESCDDTVFEENPNNGHPYTTSAVYDVSVNATYVDDRIQHSRTVEIAPDAE